LITELSTQQQIKLYYDLHVPDQRRAGGLPLLIALHGYEGSKETMMKLAQKINSTDFAIVSLQAPNAFFLRGDGGSSPRIGFGWMMRYKAEETIELHHRALLSIIDHACASYPINQQAVFLLAFSQSVSLNYRFAFTHPNTIRGVIAVCGGIPGDWSQEKYKQSDTDVLIVAGEADEFYPLERTSTFKDEIARRAASVEFMSFPVGHIFPREALPVINRWILDRT
jgi:predicted esterase